MRLIAYLTMRERWKVPWNENQTVHETISKECYLLYGPSGAHKCQWLPCDVCMLLWVRPYGTNLSWGKPDESGLVNYSVYIYFITISFSSQPPIQTLVMYWCLKTQKSNASTLPHKNIKFTYWYWSTAIQNPEQLLYPVYII